MNIFQMSLSGALLIIVLVIIRAFVMDHISKRMLMLLWNLVFIRLLIPFSVPAKYAFFRLVNLLFDKASAGSSNFARGRIYYNSMAGIKSDKFISQLGIPGWLPEGIWIAGACLLGSYFLIVYLKSRKQFNVSLPVTQFYERPWQDYGMRKRNIQVRQSDRIGSPLTYGIFKPTILFPSDTDWNADKQIRFIMMHEYMHIVCYDSLRKMIMVLTLCLHWFNPLVWIMFILVNRDIELSCDEKVIQHVGKEERASYASMLIDMEETKSRKLSPLYSNFSKYAIEERIVAIMKLKKKSMIIGVVAAALMICTMTAFADSRENSSKQEENTEAVKIEKADSTETVSDQGAGEIKTSGGTTDFKIAEDDNIEQMNEEEALALLEAQKSKIQEQRKQGELTEEEYQRQKEQLDIEIKSLQEGTLTLFHGATEEGDEILFSIEMEAN